MGTVLVAYASKRGSTAEIARAIANVLRESGLAVDCVPAGEVASLDCDAVVLGSAVYMKRWRRGARRFLRRHGGELAQRPFWVFSSGPVGKPRGEANAAWLEPRRIVERVEELGVRGHVVFGGRMPTEPKGRIERSMVKNAPYEYRDLRDWDAIRAWATTVAGEVKSEVGEEVA